MNGSSQSQGQAEVGSYRKVSRSFSVNHICGMRRVGEFKSGECVLQYLVSDSGDQ